MDNHVVSVYKNAGETPLECLERVRKEHPEFSHMPMTYAGRLDPMAEGVLLLLVGDECLKKDDYLNLPKQYELTVLFGFATDTYDLLGKITEGPEKESEEIFRSGEPIRGPKISSDSFSGLEEEITKLLPKFSGKFQQKYPPYSSRTVNSRPLFKWAREGRLNEITIPMHEVFVENIELKNIGMLSAKQLLKHIEKTIPLVQGDFRQDEILGEWRTELINSDKEFPFAKFSIICSSGTYVRAIAHELGEALNVPALAMKIVRTKVGEYEAKK